MKLQFIVKFYPPPFFFLGKELGSSTFSTHGKRVSALKFIFPREGCDVGKRFTPYNDPVVDTVNFFVCGLGRDLVAIRK